MRVAGHTDPHSTSPGRVEMIPTGNAHRRATTSASAQIANPSAWRSLSSTRKCAEATSSARRSTSAMRAQCGVMMRGDMFPGGVLFVMTDGDTVVMNAILCDVSHPDALLLLTRLSFCCCKCGCTAQRDKRQQTSAARELITHQH